MHKFNFYIITSIWLFNRCGPDQFGDSLESNQLELNDGFEQSSNTLPIPGHWYSNERVIISENGYFAPPEGKSFALLESEGIMTRTITSLDTEKSYKFNIWARSLNERGNNGTTKLRMIIRNGDEIITSQVWQVDVPTLNGVAESIPNDDGANVWIDGPYRHQFADEHIYQNIDQHPIHDPWQLITGSGYNEAQGQGLGFAVGNIITPYNRLMYGTDYDDVSDEPYSSILLSAADAQGKPDYNWTQPVTILSHTGSEFPWVLDAHLYYDSDTDRLWMSWGGGVCYVTEMNPRTGLFLTEVEETEFYTHPEEMHVPVATWSATKSGWCGDDWSSCWMEGAALYKNNGHWYFFGSYGDLGTNYTIRMGRGNSPQGPFYDKEGIELMAFDLERSTFGNTMLLGDEGSRMVPGHPHIWEENGQHFLGYDYRRPSDVEEMDYMGIRMIYWFDGWPTIWQPLQIELDEEIIESNHVESLTIEFINVGDRGTKVGLDAFEIKSF